MNLNRIIIYTCVLFCNLAVASPRQEEGPDTAIDLHSPRAVPTRSYANLASPRALKSSKSAPVTLPETPKAKKNNIAPCLNLRIPLRQLEPEAQNPTAPEEQRKKKSIKISNPLSKLCKSPRGTGHKKVVSQDNLRNLEEKVKKHRATTLERKDQQKRVLQLIRQALAESDETKVAELTATLAKDYEAYKEMLKQPKAYEAQQKQPALAAVEKNENRVKFQQALSFPEAGRSVQAWLIEEGKGKYSFKSTQ